ncbi:hypothetical protein LTS10_003719 [Elasticomyces elasticus]|nr:hypothetical protein LTS10_003719 [Elasticomyces elasticus]
MSAPKMAVVNTTKEIANLADWLVSRHTPPVPSTPTMYIDLEGVQLSRDGTLSILTLLVDEGTAEKQVYLIDIHSLGAKAFDTAGTKQKTMKDILQDDAIPKVFFDIRNDSDALFAHFGVKMAGVEDVQLMENATRTTTKQRRLVSGLAKCIEQNVHGASTVSWKLAKEKGEKLFKAEHGGSYEVFNQRPSVRRDHVLLCWRRAVSSGTPKPLLAANAGMPRGGRRSYGETHRSVTERRLSPTWAEQSPCSVDCRGERDVGQISWLFRSIVVNAEAEKCWAMEVEGVVTLSNLRA